LALRGSFTVQEKKEEINPFVRVPVREKKIAANGAGAGAGLPLEIRPANPVWQGERTRNPAEENRRGKHVIFY
jgi:hypothetical protein